MAEHTPTPWVIPAGPGNDFIVCEGDDPSSPGQILFVLHKPLGRRNVAVDQQIAANAAFIVKAVNSHDVLVKALDGMVLVCGRTGDSFEDFEEQAAAFQRETGKMRPGKDMPMSSGGDDDYAVRRLAYQEWVQEKLSTARAALSPSKGDKA